MRRSVHILTEAQLTEYQRTQHLNCAEHAHASREEAENKLHWRLVREVSDRIVVKRTWQEPDRSRLREFSGWALLNKWSEPGWQLVTPDTR